MHRLPRYSLSFMDCRFLCYVRARATRFCFICVPFQPSLNSLVATVSAPCACVHLIVVQVFCVQAPPRLTLPDTVFASRIHVPLPVLSLAHPAAQSLLALILLQPIPLLPGARVKFDGRHFTRDAQLRSIVQQATGKDPQCAKTLQQLLDSACRDFAQRENTEQFYARCVQICSIGLLRMGAKRKRANERKRER